MTATDSYRAMGLESIIAGGGKHAAMKRIIEGMRKNIADVRKTNDHHFAAMMDVYSFCLFQVLTDGAES